eukprot:1176256-Prorocentrum_minimum.AAC.3
MPRKRIDVLRCGQARGRGRGARTCVIQLSWPYALLFPSRVIPISSPITIMGVPCDTIRAVMKFFIWRARSPLIAGSS